MSGERQPRKQRGQGASAANEQPPPLQLSKELKKQRRWRATDKRPETLPPLSLDRGRAGGEEASRDVTPGSPKGSPFLTCPPEGKEAEEEEVPGCMTSEEVRARGVAFSAGGTEPEGRERLRSVYVRFFAKKFPLRRRPPNTKVTSHVLSANFAPTPSTSGVGIPVQRGQECTTFLVLHPRTNS